MLATRTSATKARPSRTGSVASIMTGLHGVTTAGIRSGWASAMGSAGSRAKAHGPSLASRRRVASRRRPAYLRRFPRGTCSSRSQGAFVFVKTGTARFLQYRGMARLPRYGVPLLGIVVRLGSGGRKRSDVVGVSEQLGDAQRQAGLARPGWPGRAGCRGGSRAAGRPARGAGRSRSAHCAAPVPKCEALYTGRAVHRPGAAQPQRSTRSRRPAGGHAQLRRKRLERSEVWVGHASQGAGGETRA